MLRSASYAPQEHYSCRHIKETSLAYDRPSWQEWTSFVLCSNNIYCSTLIADRIENIKITTIYKVNQIWKHLYSDWSQTPYKRTYTKLTAWLHTSASADSCRTRHRPYHRLDYISYWQLPTSELHFGFTVSHKRHNCLVNSDGHWLLYHKYIDASGLLLSPTNYFFFEWTLRILTLYIICAE
jgi:hypothetical protein